MFPDRALFASLIFLGFVLRTGHITDMTGEAITAVQLADLAGRNVIESANAISPLLRQIRSEPYCRAARLDQP